MTVQPADASSVSTAAAAAPDRSRRRPVQDRSAETFRRIEEAATQLLGRGVSLEAMTTPQIARAAGVSVGGLYRFFPDKQAIVDAIALRRLADFEAAISADVLARPPFASGGALVSYIIDIFVHYLDAHPEFRTILYGGSHLSRDIRQRHFGHDAKSAQLARRYVAEVLGVPDSAELALRWRLVGEITGPLIGFALEQATAAARQAVLREVKRLVLGYLFDEPAAPRAADCATTG